MSSRLPWSRCLDGCVYAGLVLRFNAMKPTRALSAALCLLLVAQARGAEMIRLERADYVDRVRAVWVAQIAAVLADWPFEHQTASTLWITNYPKKYTTAPVDDDWYYEMVAIRAFEKQGVNLTVEQLGEQWKENACGSWGSSEQARLNL